MYHVIILNGDGNKIRRRQFMAKAVYTLGVAATLGFGGYFVKNYLTSLSERPDEEIIVGRDDKGLYAEFRGDSFRASAGNSEREGLDKVLYELNNKQNPHFPIKGDRLFRLRDLFEHLNQIEEVDNLKVGEVRKFKHKSKPINTLDGIYYFPFYDLEGKLA